MTNDVNYWCKPLRDVCVIVVASGRNSVGQAIVTPTSISKDGTQMGKRGIRKESCLRPKRICPNHQDRLWCCYHEEELSRCECQRVREGTKRRIRLPERYFCIIRRPLNIIYNFLTRRCDIDYRIPPLVSLILRVALLIAATAGELDIKCDSREISHYLMGRAFPTI